jgi:hypothetical protein
MVELQKSYVIALKMLHTISDKHTVFHLPLTVTFYPWNSISFLRDHLEVWLMLY